MPVDLLPFLQGRQFLLPRLVILHTKPLLNGSTQKGKNLLPSIGSKFLIFRTDPFQRGQNNFDGYILNLYHFCLKHSYDDN